MCIQIHFQFLINRLDFYFRKLLHLQQLRNSSNNLQTQWINLLSIQKALLLILGIDRYRFHSLVMIDRILEILKKIIIARFLTLISFQQSLHCISQRRIILLSLYAYLILEQPREDSLINLDEGLLEHRQRQWELEIDNFISISPSLYLLGTTGPSAYIEIMGYSKWSLLLITKHSIWLYGFTNSICRLMFNKSY